MLITQGNVKTFRNVLLVIITIYLVLGATLSLLQERLLFLPNELEETYVFNFDIDFEELKLHPESKVLISAVHFKIANPKGIVLYCHGNAGDLTRWGRIASSFTAYGYEVLVWDYRTYGKSKGPLSESAINRDAQYLYNYLHKTFRSEDIILYGRSLGTGVASYLAANNAAQQLILETPFYSITDVAKYRFPFFPVEWLMRYKFPNNEYLPKVHCPITILHGTKDKVVPYRSAQKLKSIGLKGLEFVTIIGGGHNNLSDFEKFHSVIAKCLH